MSGACGTPLRRTAPAVLEVSRRRTLRVALFCAAALVVGLSSAHTAPAATSTSPRPQPQHLWREYPLDPAHGGSRTKQSPRTAPSPSTDEGTSGGGSTNILIAVGAAMLLAASAAAFVLHRLRTDVSIRGGIGSIRSSWVVYRPPEGGMTMANRRRRKWALRDPEVAAPLQQQPNEDGHAESTPQAETVDEPAAGSNETELPADLSDVGAEVGAVLKSAREAAARIRNQAKEESAKLLQEAQATAEAEIEEARQIATEDRAEGERVRAEAEAYDNETRADAETFAEQTRADAESEAAKIVEEARARLEAADADVAQKVRDLTANARERLNTLQAGSRRHEERLEHMLVVFRAMTSQLEELLAERASESDGDADADETLDEALQPGSTTPRAG
jgi:F0F1-type ATP synthase membrane subunit b/b'